MCGILSLTQIYVVAAGTATAFVWRDAGNFGAIRALVGRDMLASAYSRIASLSSVMAIAGPAAGGLLAATIGPAPSMTIDSVSYIISGLLLASIHQPFSTSADGRPMAPALDAALRYPLTWANDSDVIRGLGSHPVLAQGGVDE